MIKFEDDVNVNIYNLYHKRMLNRRPNYIYVLWYNDRYNYNITQIDFKYLESFYNENKNIIFTVERKLDDAIKHAEKFIIESIKDNTGNFTGDNEESEEISFDLYWHNKKGKILNRISYSYNPFMTGTYSKKYFYDEIVKLGAEK